MTEDDDIRQLFASYSPVHATTDEDFMDELEKSMESIEIVKRQISANGRLRRRAAFIAAAVGFAVGSTLTVILSAAGTFNISLPQIDGYVTSAQLSWLVIASATVISSFCSYSFSKPLKYL